MILLRGMYVKRKFPPMKMPFKVTTKTHSVVEKRMINHTNAPTIGTNPRDDEEETCLTKSSMIANKDEPSFICLQLQNQLYM